MADNFQDKVEILTDQALDRLRKWDRDKAAKEVMREYLNEEGMVTKSGSKLTELLDERHRMALNSVDEAVKLKAIDSALTMAAGNEKVTNVQNNQFNFGKFLDDMPEK